jgi:hypothetical protein
LLGTRDIVVLNLGLALAAALSCPPRAAAVDAFEIQVYDGSANAPGVPGLELHVNGVPRGLAFARAPELPPNHQAHLTLEPALGVTSFWELGAYLQTAVLPDGGFDFAGVKLRSKVITPPGWRPRLHLGCNFEVSWVRAAYETERWGGELRPIVAWEDGRWHLAVNPIVELSFAGAAPAFAPALMALIKIRDLLAFGVEYYADLGAVTAPLPWRDQQHYLFEVVNVIARPNLELNVGIGEGLTPGSNALVTKVIAGYSFEGFSFPHN